MSNLNADTLFVHRGRCHTADISVKVKSVINSGNDEQEEPEDVTHAALFLYKS